MSSLRDENLQKKIGCMTGIFQFFDFHHINGCSSKRLLQVGKHQMDQQYAKKSVMEEKTKISNDSSRASFSSSSCSSTFSSLDFNRTIQQETVSQRQSSTPESQFQTTGSSNRSHDLRDVVKESMHREVRSLSIKLHNSGERRGTVMKHIDSPRPLKHSNVANELLTLHRSSYDGRESREVNSAGMKMKELPRLSLDSKTNSIKALESRLNQEPGSHNRRSSVVARLMGLEASPDATSTDERGSPPLITKEALLSQLSLTSDEHKQNQANYSPRVSQNNPTKKQDSSQDSPKMASRSRKGAADTLQQTSSVYGQIKKRITELEFQKSGKDLRALKQILESMEKKTIARTTDQHSELTSRRCSLEERCPHQNTKTFHQAKLRTSTPKIHKPSSAQIQKAQNLTPKSRKAKTHDQHVASTDKKSNLELDRALKTTQRMNLETCTTPCRSPAAVSPRLQQNPLRTEAESRRAKMQHGSKKDTEKGSQSRKNRVKAKEAEIISLVYSIDTNTQVDKNLVSVTREHNPAVGSDVTILEQPSPISVLDSTFYCEDSPSPVKKITTVFQEDKSPSPDEAEWFLQNHLMDCRRPNQSFKYNQQLEDMKRSVQKLIQLNKEPDRTASNRNESLNPAHRYINKILLTSGLLKDSSFISTTDMLFSSPCLINPQIFLDLEQTKDIRDAVNRAVIQNNDRLNLDKAIQRKMVFDLVDEILVRKMTSSRLFTEGKKQTSPEGLLKEVQLEMDHLCKTPDCNLEEGDMIRVLAADINYQSKDWIDYSGEAPSVALDVERLIFKDLINEVITGELMEPKRHSRKLFGK